MANFFHKNCFISNLASIEVSSKGSNTFIGANTYVDDFVKIKHTGGNGSIKIGKNCNINSGTVLYSGSGIDIGDNTLIGPNCSIVAANHEFKNKNKLIRNQGFNLTKLGIKIEDDVWIGANVVITPGSIIRRGSVIGANSFVNKETKPYSINYGNPLKLIKYRK